MNSMLWTLDQQLFVTVEHLSRIFWSNHTALFCRDENATAMPMILDLDKLPSFLSLLFHRSYVHFLHYCF